MNEAMRADASPSAAPDHRSDLLKQYGCGPIRFSGTDDGLYERHLLFDDVVTPASAGPHERYRAVARSVRDVLSQRWVRTETTYDRENPKRVYYLSMEFLIGRSLSNNISNCYSIRSSGGRPRNVTSTGSVSLRKSPMPASETVGSDALRHASSIQWRRCNFQQWATGCATNTESSNNQFATAGSSKSRIIGCLTTTPGRCVGRTRRSKSSSTVRLP